MRENNSAALLLLYNLSAIPAEIARFRNQVQQSSYSDNVDDSTTRRRLSRPNVGLPPLSTYDVYNRLDRAADAHHHDTHTHTPVVMESA